MATLCHGSLTFKNSVRFGIDGVLPVIQPNLCLPVGALGEAPMRNIHAPFPHQSFGTVRRRARVGPFLRAMPS